VRCSEAMNNSLWTRRVIGVIVIVLLGVANVVDMVRAETTIPCAVCNYLSSYLMFHTELPYNTMQYTSGVVRLHIRSSVILLNDVVPTI
jgi:hypothetical protein